MSSNSSPDKHFVPLNGQQHVPRVTLNGEGEPQLRSAPQPQPLWDVPLPAVERRGWQRWEQRSGLCCLGETAQDSDKTNIHKVLRSLAQSYIGITISTEEQYETNECLKALSSGTASDPWSSDTMQIRC